MTARDTPKQQRYTETATLHSRADVFEAFKNYKFKANRATN